MSGIMKRLRDETERAKFETGRALRLQREQSKLAQMQGQRRDQLQALGELVWEMFQAGQIADPRQATICRQIQGVQQQINDQENQIERIKQEQPPEPPKCAQCGREVSSNDTFCPNCGGRVSSVEQSAGGTAVAGAQPCPNCGKSVRVGATFCGSCGARLGAA